MPTDAEILENFRDYMARRGDGREKFVPLRNNPGHVGVVDNGYIRPAPREFPKMVYHASGMSKIVQSRKEQDALGAQWGEVPASRPSNWRAKLNEVFTKSGFRVQSHHLEFLRSNAVPVETLAAAAEFLDQLDEKQQEQFFREAEAEPEPVQVEKKAEEHKKKVA